MLTIPALFIALLNIVFLLVYGVVMALTPMCDGGVKKQEYTSISLMSFMFACVLIIMIVGGLSNEV